MTFDQAVEQAREISRRNRCTVNVNGRIVLLTGAKPVPIIDPQGWATSDWYVDGSTAQTFHLGEPDE